MMMTFDDSILAEVVATAKASASAYPRWIKAIDKAAVELATNPYIAMVDGDLIIASESGAVYHVNGVCDCQAGSFGQPCYHRAAKRLLKRYNEVKGQAR